MFGIDDAALAGILGGLISTAGKLYTNRENISAEEKANEINWEIARLNNATEVEMANTAHQREIADLRAAGLNPILSAGGNGSSTPTLQTPTLNPVHTDSDLFEGLANSAKGMQRYFGEQYRSQLETSQETARQLRIDNNLADLQSQVDEVDLDAQFAKSTIEKIAALKETGLTVHRDPRTGELKTVLDDFGAASDAVDLAREGIRSDFKQRANANWRANLSSFVPFVSPSAVNSARQVVRPTRRFR